MLHHISVYIVRDLQYFILYVAFLEHFFIIFIYQILRLILNFQNTIYKILKLNEIFIARLSDIWITDDGDSWNMKSN